MTDLIKRDDALLPCPFCGGDKNIICRTDYDGRDAYAVSCRYHECHGAIFMLGYGYFADKAEAIAAWNTRALPAVDRIEALVKERDDYAHKLMDANNTYTEMHLEIERLSDKLAKAVKALRESVKEFDCPIAIATLAELGETE